MGRPRKFRPPPRPVGRPRKPVDLAAKLAQMSEAELIQLEQYQRAINAPKNGRLRMGDVRSDGKVFMWYQPYWTTPAVYERYKKRLREYMRLRLERERQEKANTECGS
jgi:hypothetical protein